MTHPIHGLDDIVHQRVRLGILTIAHETNRVDFTYLQTTMGLTGGNLSQHLAVLETAGFIEVEKGYEGKKAKTWIAITKKGKTALREEIKYLKTLIGQVEKAAKSKN